MTKQNKNKQNPHITFFHQPCLSIWLPSPVHLIVQALKQRNQLCNFLYQKPHGISATNFYWFCSLKNDTSNEHKLHVSICSSPEYAWMVFLKCRRLPKCSTHGHSFLSSNLSAATGLLHMLVSLPGAQPSHLNSSISHPGKTFSPASQLPHYEVSLYTRFLLPDTNKNLQKIEESSLGILQACEGR